MRHPSTTAVFPAGNAVRMLWLARWLLVLVLVLIWDQIGSPMHHRRHDSAVDAQWVGASAVGGEAIAHAEAEDHDSSSFAHSILAVRPRSDAGLMADAPASAHGLALPVAIAFPSPMPGLPIVSSALGQGPPPSYRSLPPAGRAPPLHA
ncbi:MAG: hypothetical protein M3150_04640 [Pseudomonadota bacterium]|nr:hypothetical protein [Pseudomonadota bacterium]